jgi:hypothetical protein
LATGNGDLFRSRARTLLRELLESEAVSRKEVIRELMTQSPVLDAFVEGSRAIPLEKQALLAALLIERVPRFRRAGHQLRGQIVAAIRYAAGETEVHIDGPVGRLR